MKYSLRSLMIVVTLGPVLLAGGWFGYLWLFGGQEITEPEFDPDAWQRLQKVEP